MSSSQCIGHELRTARKNKITKMLKEPCNTPKGTKRVLIKKGPVSVESSLKELEDFYASRPEWEVIKEGGVLSVPVQEYRLMNPPNPDRDGNVVFGQRKGSTRKQIDHYTVAETIGNLNAIIKEHYNKVKAQALARGKSVLQAEAAAQAEALQLPQFQAVNMWQDIEAEIKVKLAVEKMMRSLKIPALVIRSVNLKAISPLRSLGIKVPDKGGEIDIVLAYASGEYLHIVLFEVKRCDTYPWQDTAKVPSKQAVNKAENQLTKDLDVLMALLAGIPPDKIIFHTLACYPDSSLKQLESIFCSGCLRESVVGQGDIGFLLHLRRKTKIFYETAPPEGKGNGYLLTLSARCLSHQSLLHVGYRELKDKETLAIDKHKFNQSSVDRKLMQNEFVVASPQQQEVIERYKSGRLAERHLALEGPAGTGKTLVALQVAKHLLESFDVDRETKEGMQDSQDSMEAQEEEDSERQSIIDDTMGRHKGLAKFLMESAPVLQSKDEEEAIESEKAEHLSDYEDPKPMHNRMKPRVITHSRIVSGKKQANIMRELLQRRVCGFFPTLQCNECEYTCRSSRVLKDHVMMEHSEDRFKYKRRYNPLVEGPVLIVTAGSRDLRSKDPILKHLGEITKDVATKVCLGWEELCRSLAIRYNSDLPSLLKAISGKWLGREIVMVVDEIIDMDVSNFFGKDPDKFWIPKSIRLVLVFNPVSHLTMPPQIVRVSLTVPYRSTKSITSLTRFMAKWMNMTKTFEGEIGSDVEGELPGFIDVTTGQMEGQLGEALAVCRSC